MRISVPHLIVLAAGLSATALPAFAQTDEDAAVLVATQVREQGFTCADPVSAEQQGVADTDAVWVLTCGNASYRVRLVPDQAAVIEELN
jgi:hypothetical protein